MLGIDCKLLTPSVVAWSGLVTAVTAADWKKGASVPECPKPAETYDKFPANFGSLFLIPARSAQKIMLQTSSVT